LMPTGVEFAHNLPVRHAWMCHVLRKILIGGLRSFLAGLCLSMSLREFLF
jgi:hypothetical protein